MPLVLPVILRPDTAIIQEGHDNPTRTSYFDTLLRLHPQLLGWKAVGMLGIVFPGVMACVGDFLDDVGCTIAASTLEWWDCGCFGRIHCCCQRSPDGVKQMERER